MTILVFKKPTVCHEESVQVFKIKDYFNCSAYFKKCKYAFLRRCLILIPNSFDSMKAHISIVVIMRFGLIGIHRSLRKLDQRKMKKMRKFACSVLARDRKSNPTTRDMSAGCTLQCGIIGSCQCSLHAQEHKSQLLKVDFLFIHLLTACRRELGEARKSNGSTDSDLLNIWLRRLLLEADILGVKG